MQRNHFTTGLGVSDGAMTIIIETREDFTLDAYARIAWARESTLFGDTAMTRMNEPRAAFMMLID